MYAKCGYYGTFDVEERDVAINESGMLSFRNLSLSAYGDVAFTFECVTTPDSEYSFTVQSEVISVQPDILPTIQVVRELSFKFNRDFDDIVDDVQIFRSAAKNFLIQKFHSRNIILDQFRALKGMYTKTFIEEIDCR